MCPFDGKKGQTKMQMFFSIWYLLVLTLLREGFDLFSCVLGRLVTKSLYKSHTLSPVEQDTIVYVSIAYLKSILKPHPFSHSSHINDPSRRMFSYTYG